MKTLKRIMIAVLLIFVIGFMGYALLELFSADSGNDNINLTITEEIWWEFGSETVETTFDEVEVKDILYDKKMGRLKVAKVSSDQIILKVKGGFVEYEDGGINMQAEDLTKIKLNKGESKAIASKSYDAGVVITITFN